MRLIMVLVLLILGTGKLLADVNSNQAALLIQEQNGTNVGRYRVLKVPNGTTTNNNDGSVSLAAGLGLSPSGPSNAIQYKDPSTGNFAGTSNATLDALGNALFGHIGFQNNYTDPYGNSGDIFTDSQTGGSMFFTTANGGEFVLSPTADSDIGFNCAAAGGSGVPNCSINAGSYGIQMIADQNGNIDWFNVNNHFGIHGGAGTVFNVDTNGVAVTLNNTLDNSGRASFGTTDLSYAVNIYDVYGTGYDIGDAITGYWNVSNLGAFKAASYSVSGGMTGCFLTDGSGDDCNTYLTTSSASSTYAPIASPTFTTKITTPAVFNTFVGVSKNCATSGTVTWYMPEQGSGYKKVIGYANACIGASASWTFPTAFAHTPAAVTTNELASSLLTTLSTSAVVLTGTTSTGYILIEGT